VRGATTFDQSMPSGCPPGAMKCISEASGRRLIAAVTRALTSPRCCSERTSSRISSGRCPGPSRSARIAALLRACSAELFASSAMRLALPLVDELASVR
jgi:hypothetical protein